jgi:phosphoribosyl 1,2-cyclic phosphate phosphodiesterase
MKITILGCGTSTGVPIVGCRCPVCSSPDPRDNRTRASIFVETGGNNILIDTSTDLRRQALRENISRIDAVFYTHSHADHVNGIDDLRGFHFINRKVVPCFGGQPTLDDLNRIYRYIFTGAEEDGYPQLLEPHVICDPFHLFGLRIVPVPLLHGTMPCMGYRIDDVAYLTDCSVIPDSSIAMLQGLDILIIDGLRYLPHTTHFNIEKALEVIQLLSPRRAVLTHLTHDVAYAEREKLPDGVDFAFDGMILDAEGQL